MRRSLFILLFFTSLAPLARAQSGCPSTTAIGSIACSMTAGQWVHIANSTQTGFNSGNVLQPPAGGSATEFADKAQYNPVNDTLMFLGGSHTTTTTNCDSTLFVSYTDSTNTWSNTNLNSPCPTYTGSFACTGASGNCANLGHAYQDNTIDPATGNFFYREYGAVNVSIYKQSTQAWSSLPNFEPSCSSGSSCTEGGLEWFPDRNSLVLVDGTAGVFECVFSGSNSNGTPCSSWTQIACTGFNSCSGMEDLYNRMGPYQNFAVYSKMCRCIAMGGGGTTFVATYGATANWSIKNAAPFTLDQAAAGGGNAWVIDPISGLFLVADVGSCYVWTYNPQTDTWTQVSVEPQCPTAENGVADIITFPWTNYDVTEWVYQGEAGSNGSIYLYKNSSVANGDFTYRCYLAGSFMCNALSTSGDIAGAYGSVSGNCCAGSTAMAIDTSNYPANAGSMVCAIPANATGDDPCSDFFQNFSTTKTLFFSDNSTFYVQAAMWMDTAYLADEPANGEGQKQFILGSGDPNTCTTGNTSTCQTSCTYAEIVMLNDMYRGNPSGFPTLYQNCGDYAPLSTPISTSWNPNNYLLEPNEPSPYCLQYLNPTGGQPGSTFFSPYGTCEAYPTGQWWSFEIEVALGAYNSGDQSYDNSHISLWIAPLGQSYNQPYASYTYNIHDQSHLGYGKIWLLTYDTGATSWAGNYKVRWAELIGSTSFIPAPQTDAAGNTSVVLSPSSENFGSVNVGSSSAPVTFTVTNNNSASATSAYVSLGGSDPSDFSFSSNTCGTSGSMTTLSGSGATCTVNVTFTPGASGSRSATLNFNYSGADSASPQTASLSGMGIAPQVATPTFSPVAGTYPGTQMVTISTSTGGATICWEIGSAPTTNGAGTCTSGNTYSGAFTISSSEILYAIGTKSGDTDSSTASAAYTITVANPAPAAGMFAHIFNEFEHFYKSGLW
jgi:hypothetical protein